MHKPIKLDLPDFKINLHDHVVNLLTERHVKLADLAEIVYNDQQKYNPDISRDFYERYRTSNVWKNICL